MTFHLLINYARVRSSSQVGDPPSMEKICMNRRRIAYYNENLVVIQHFAHWSAKVWIVIWLLLVLCFIRSVWRTAEEIFTVESEAVSTTSNIMLLLAKRSANSSLQHLPYWSLKKACLFLKYIENEFTTPLALCHRDREIDNEACFSKLLRSTK